MIVDCHTHIFPERIREDRESFCRKDLGFSLIYRASNSKMASVEDLIESMDRSGVHQSVVCGFSWSDPTLLSLHNEYLMESANRYPDRIIVFIGFSFSDPEWSWRELEKRMKEGARGVGEIAFYDRSLGLEEIGVMKPVLKKMEEERIPIMLHTNELIGHSYPGKGKTPLERFYEFVLSFPRLPVLFAHWGGGFPFYELMPEVSRAFRQVYYDTAASPYLYSNKIYKVVGDMVGVEKILFGSDYPLISPDRYFKELEGSGLSETDREKILGKNFLSFMGLEKKFASE